MAKFWPKRKKKKKPEVPNLNSVPNSSQEVDYSAMEVIDTTSLVPDQQKKHSVVDPEEIDQQQEQEQKANEFQPFCFSCFREKGNMILLCGSEQNSFFPQQFLIGPNYVCMSFTYLLILLPSLAFLIFIAPEYHYAISILLVCLLCVTLVSFSMIACSDPGIIFKSYQMGNEEGGVICAQCQIRRPPKALHCYDCDVCIDELDHHCPWTGKCIGKKTIRWFYAFLWAITLLLMFLLVLSLYHYAQKHF